MRPNNSWSTGSGVFSPSPVMYIATNSLRHQATASAPNRPKKQPLQRPQKRATTKRHPNDLIALSHLPPLPTRVGPRSWNWHLVFRHPLATKRLPRFLRASPSTALDECAVPPKAEQTRDYIKESLCVNLPRCSTSQDGSWPRRTIVRTSRRPRRVRRPP